VIAMRAFIVGVLALIVALPSAAGRYAVHRDGDIIRLEDATSQTVVSIVPPVGNVAFDMTVKGHKILRFPYTSIDEFRKMPRLSGIPFMAPWANRLDEQAFYANGRKYAFDMALGNVRGKIPIHGFLSYVPWQAVEAKADGRSAWVTSRLEFYRQPLWMAQFPFAHTLEMTYRLHDGALEVATRIQNLSAEPMPVSVGYHPYFQLTDSARDEWTVSIGARSEWLLSPEKIPTGETRPIEQLLPNPKQAPLRDLDLDHVFGDLARDASGRAVMYLMGKSQRIDVSSGPNYRAAVIYAPKPTQTQPDRNFVCFEPMAGITNALNLAHRGVYKELQSIPAGGVWQESFWVKASGF
jgi:aldose 1-epimerase